MLTGRYKLELDANSQLVLFVEDAKTRAGFVWRLATIEDLPRLEPMVADGWRFVTERNGILLEDGKRLR